MASPPESTKTSLRQRLQARVRDRWPVLASVTTRHHGAFAYISGHLADDTVLPLFRLRYNGSATTGGSPSIWPAETATKTPSCPAATPPEPQKKPWTAPAGYTSTTLPPGSNPRRTNGRNH
ncbi:hypothetical protein GCM10022222_51390 [Amycolatopsis ultiminotia]|uniref:Uncharacterized protein n=1 Tax=Amycolatopsis ultiminotia TaxID=543629 RepID=A0ABP6X4H3_9PSEU